MEVDESGQGTNVTQNSRKRMPTDGLESDDGKNKNKHAKVTNVDLSHRDPHAKVRLTISNIPYEVKWQDLKDLFKAAINSDVCYVEIFNGLDGRPSGIGVVEVANPELAKKAIESLHRHEVQGRMIIVREETDEDIAKRQLAASGSYNNPMMLGQNQMMNKSMMSPLSSGLLGVDSDFAQMLYECGIDPESITNQVFVANVDYRATVEDIEELFRIAGNVVAVEQKLDKDNKPRGMFIVRFEHPIESVQAIFLFHLQHYRDRQLKVKMDRIINLKSQIVPMGLPPGLQSIGKGLGTGGKPLYNIAQIANMAALDKIIGTRKKPASSYPERALAMMKQQQRMSGVMDSMGGGGMPGTSSAGLDLDTIVEATVKAVTGRLGGLFGNSGTGMEMEKRQDFTGMDMTYDTYGSGRGSVGLYTQFEDDVNSYDQLGGLGGNGGGQGDMNPALVSPVPGLECFTIIIKNLPMNYNWQKLKDKGKQIGKVKFAEVKMGSSGRSLGLGTITFVTSADAKKAVLQWNGSILDGRRLEVRLGYV